MSLIRISEAEWHVMNIVWSRAPVSSADVVSALMEEQQWQPRTIRTLLDRLVKKKALKLKTNGKRNLYEPLITMEACVRQESRSFLERVFGGEPAAMLLHLVGEAKLSKAEIRKLKEILSDNEKYP